MVVAVVHLQGNSTNTQCRLTNDTAKSDTEHQEPPGSRKTSIVKQPTQLSLLQRDDCKRGKKIYKVYVTKHVPNRKVPQLIASKSKQSFNNDRTTVLICLCLNCCSSCVWGFTFGPCPEMMLLLIFACVFVRHFSYMHLEM